MAKRSAILPTWVRSVGAAIDEGAAIRVSCTRCRLSQDVDLVALAAKVGRDYSLIDRRCRCRLTEGCSGWNRFLYLNGVFRPLWTEAAVNRWA